MRPARAGAFAREVVVSALAQRVFTAVTLLVVAGSTLTILMTSGRSAGAEAAVLNTIDAQGTRTITVQTLAQDVGLTSDLVDQLARLPEVESVVGLGQVVDATAAAVPEGARVGIRTAYGTISGRSLSQTRSPLGPVVWASRASVDALGLSSPAGAIRVVDGAEYHVAGELEVPAFLADLEPLTVIPATLGIRGGPVSLTSIVILTATPDAVGLVTTVVRSYLIDIPSELVTVTTSEQLAALRSAVGGELTRQGRTVILGVLGSATAVTLINVWGFVLMRRKDLGRRRALGATRLSILALYLAQVFLTAALAGAIGATLGLVALAYERSPLPSTSYAAAVVLALTLAATIAAAMPVAVAANRDPLRELRVP